MEENLLNKQEPQVQQPTQETAPTPSPIQETAQTVMPKPYKAPVRRGRPISRKKLIARNKVARYYGEEVKEEEPPKETPQPRRKERIPFGVPRPSIETPKGDGYHYRVFNDNWSREPDRIQRAVDAGYEVVRNVNARGTNEDGSPIEGVLMRIPESLYKEDQSVKQKEIDKVDQEIHRGRFQEKASDKRYIPPSGIKIDSKLNP